MPLHWSFGHLQPKLWAKERSRVKLAVWLPTTKSRESTSSRHPNRECDTRIGSATRRWKAPKESYNFGSDLVLIKLGNREIWAPKVPGLQLGQFRDNFGTPTWESRENVPFRCSSRRELQRILYEGRWWLPPSPGRGESCVSKCSWLVPTPKGVPERELTLLWLVLDADSSLII